MCGIVGYIGERNSKDVLVSGLKRLEYRGYDSAGIAVFNVQGCIESLKTKGRMVDLENKLEDVCNGKVGIGHTRWATHGKPSDENSHPHFSRNGKFCVVHNGIIENYLELKEGLIDEGYTFKSETDTEVIPNLLEKYDTGDFKETVLKVLDLLKGAYALCVLDQRHPEEMIVVRKSSPIIIGKGEKEFFVASDIPAILEYTKDIYILEDGEIAYLNKSEISFFNEEGQSIEKESTEVTWDLESAEKQGYAHFMLKEIFEQPEAIKKTLAGRLKDGDISLILENFTDSYLKGIEKISIVACGTASYAGRVGGSLIEKYLRIPTNVYYASEFRYQNPIIDEKTLVIVVSQSGETADTLAALREGKERGAKILAITNVVDSSIARASDEVIYTLAGPEIAVASTKAYITQLVIFYLIILYLAKLRGVLDASERKVWYDALKEVPGQIEWILEDTSIFENYAKGIKDSSSAFFLGRGVDGVTALEGALKLKEISYIHAEAYAAGELKHGTLALITEGVPVITLATQKSLLEKTISNIIEVKARGALTYGIGMKDLKSLGRSDELSKVVDHIYNVPQTIEALAPVLTVVPLQLLAYYTSVFKGNDVDKPRNLAKSVTVE